MEVKGQVGPHFPPYRISCPPLCTWSRLVHSFWESSVSASHITVEDCTKLPRLSLNLGSFIPSLLSSSHQAWLRCTVYYSCYRSSLLGTAGLHYQKIVLTCFRALLYLLDLLKFTLYFYNRQLFLCIPFCLRRIHL